MSDAGMKDRVVVTGGAGFIGSEVTRQLLDRGYQVRVIDDLSKESHAAPAGVDFQQADLTVPGVAEELFMVTRLRPTSRPRSVASATSMSTRPPSCQRTTSSIR